MAAFLTTRQTPTEFSLARFARARALPLRSGLRRETPPGPGPAFFVGNQPSGVAGKAAAGIGLAEHLLDRLVFCRGVQMPVTPRNLLGHVTGEFLDESLI